MCSELTHNIGVLTHVFSELICICSELTHIFGKPTHIHSKQHIFGELIPISSELNKLFILHKQDLLEDFFKRVLATPNMNCEEHENSANESAMDDNR